MIPDVHVPVQNDRLLTVSVNHFIEKNQILLSKLYECMRKDTLSMVTLFLSAFWNAGKSLQFNSDNYLTMPHGTDTFEKQCILSNLKL